MKITTAERCQLVSDRQNDKPLAKNNGEKRKETTDGNEVTFGEVFRKVLNAGKERKEYGK